MTLLFWISLLLVFYTYVGYPMVLFVASLFLRKEIRKRRSEPRVSVILSAFNEEKWIQKKLENLLQLDYPHEKLEILIGSDGASDGTDQIISHCRSPRVRFFRFVRNFGKPYVLNALLQEANGSIVVFTDVRQEFDPRAIRELVANFEDPAIGCVSGELCFKAGNNGKRGSVAAGVGAYWNYEKFLRKKESGIGSMLGATGAIYAIRRNLFTEVPLDILVDDMYLPLSIIEKGYRVIFEPEARAYDWPSSQGKQEFKRKVRTLAGNYQMLTHFPTLLIPFKSPVAWQFFSHKVLRLLAPFFLVLLGVSNFFLLLSPFYPIFFTAQTLFYGLAVWEFWRAEGRKGKKGLGYLPYMFCLLNYSALVGLFKFLAKKQRVTWGKACV